MCSIKGSWEFRAGFSLELMEVTLCPGDTFNTTGLNRDVFVKPSEGCTPQKAETFTYYGMEVDASFTVQYDADSKAARLFVIRFAGGCPAITELYIIILHHNQYTVVGVLVSCGMTHDIAL